MTTYTLTEQNLKDLISWSRTDQNRCMKALENLQPNTQEYERESYEDWRSNFTKKVMRCVVDTADASQKKRNESSVKVVHPDDAAVDRFSASMKAKLKKSRERGKTGWQDPAWASEQISQALREHTEKGDPVDVANYCMFLSERGEGIAPNTQQPSGAALKKTINELKAAHVLSLDGQHKLARATILEVVAAIESAITNAQPLPQAKPLTGEQIDAIDQSMCGEREFIVPFARAIEAAHNIKG